MFQVGGTEFDHWDGTHVEKVVLEREDDTGIIIASVDVKIAHFFPRKGSEVKYIAFIQDNDASPYEGVSSFYDIELYEEEIVSILCVCTFKNLISFLILSFGRVQLGSTFQKKLQ